MNSLQTFEVLQENSGGEYRYAKQRGFICGRYGIHVLAWGYNYRLTHIPTGYYFHDCTRFRHAVALAAILNELPDVTPFMRPENGRLVKGDKQAYEAVTALWKAEMVKYGFKV